MYGAKFGDQSVILPDGAINSLETEDEPGIASTILTTPQALGSSMADIVTVTINIPAHGYVVLQASAQFETSGTTGVNDVYMQIDEAAGGNLIPGQFVTFGLGSYVSAGSNFFALSSQRVFFKTVGTFTFRLEGFFSSAGGTASCQSAKLTAVYYPTNYGAVVTSAAEPGDSPDAQLINSTESPRGADSKLGTGYEVDLSILEQRVREARSARIEAEKAQRQAERDLAEARRKATQNAGDSQR